MSCSLTDGRILSGGRYRLVLTTSGTGFSMLDDLMLTRWNRDALADSGGLLLYLRDLDDGSVWSAARQPLPPSRPSCYRAQYRHGCVALMRTENGIESVCETAVAPAGSFEVRRLTLRNVSERGRRIEITTYCEVVLHYWGADAGHPGFSKLFVETGCDVAHEALWARRRPRASDERFPYLVHALNGGGAFEHETDRARFIGRGRDLRRPLALEDKLSGSVGSVLDPVFSMRRVVRLAPGADATVTAVLAADHDRERALAAAASMRAADEVSSILARASDVESRRAKSFGLSRNETERLQRLAVALAYGDPLLYARGTEPTAVRRRVERARGESRDDGGATARLDLAGALELPDGAPLLGVRAKHADLDRTAATALMRTARYWDGLGVKAAWAIGCEDQGCQAPGRCPAHALAQEARQSGIAANAVSLTSSAEAIAQLERRAALVVRAEDLETLGADVGHASERTQASPRDTPGGATSSRDERGARAEAVTSSTPAERRDTSDAEAGSITPASELRAYNGYGGFTRDGREYRIVVDPRRDGARPPLPWTNVVANPQFGFLVSESGSGYTWSRNSRERRLTPWSNDPVCDPHGEALYIADEGSGDLWSPLPGPAPAPAPYEASHGFGYSSWRHTSHGIEQDVTMFVPPADTVKMVRLRLRSLDSQPRRLALASYSRLVLGDLDVDAVRFVTSEIDAGRGAVLARSRRGAGFDDAVAFAGAVAPAGADLSLSADRLSFLGADGDVARPAALLRNEPLDGRAGAGLDPCAALRLSVTLAPGETLECAFLLGEAPTREQAVALLEEYRAAGAVDDALARARKLWRDLLGAIEVDTPSEALNLIANGWALYQAGSCRLWGRSAFYQSGGAFGFRDQLQDSAAFMYSRPEITREQIVLHAGHQFPEGDVLHWWHPPIERGTRTRFSDDLCWLPYITTTYLSTTGDHSVLDEQAPFVSAPLLAAGQDEAYVAVERLAKSASVYEHCCLALDRSLTRGAHGLPLMGTGDWNDGMNRVGREGKGESVWMAFFLYKILGDFTPLCRARGDSAREQRYGEYREHLRGAIESAAWDGSWYRRAYYDDGTVLGSADNDECRIDVLAQAWAVLSGAASVERCEAALDAVERMLVVPDPGLIRLLAPPFDRTTHDPGYIKGYVPGIRENGGQYTHAALWAVRAAAELGQRERAAAWMEMILPLNHAATSAAADVYKVEPYVVAADVYGVDPHLGRGGWTWYTGSAAWMYRTIIESLLGLTIHEGRTLVIRPRVPDAWPGYRLRYTLSDGTSYSMTVENPEGHGEAVHSATLDGADAALEGGAARIAIARDGRKHEVRITLR